MYKLICGVALMSATWGAGAQRPKHPAVIDMHLHAEHANDQGPVPQYACPGVGTLAAPTDAEHMDLRTLMACAHPLKSAPNDAALRGETIAMLRRFNMKTVTSGTRLDRP